MRSTWKPLLLNTRKTFHKIYNLNPSNSEKFLALEGFEGIFLLAGFSLILSLSLSISSIRPCDNRITRVHINPLSFAFPPWQIPSGFSCRPAFISASVGWPNLEQHQSRKEVLDLEGALCFLVVIQWKQITCPQKRG